MSLVRKFSNIIKLFFREERKFYFFVCRCTGYCVSDIDLFKRAMVHKSAMKKEDGHPYNNERLEYLGDAVLDLLVADVLYEKYKDKDEGFLSSMRGHIVSRKSLNAIAMEIGIGERLVVNGIVSADKTHLPGDALEAFVGAIYLDSGLRRAKRFVRKYVVNDKVLSVMERESEDYKSLILQWSQKAKENVRFDSQEMGKNQDGTLIFISRIIKENGEVIGEGTGASKKEAEQRAAEKAFREVKVVVGNYDFMP